MKLIYLQTTTFFMFLSQICPFESNDAEILILCNYDLFSFVKFCFLCNLFFELSAVLNLQTNRLSRTEWLKSEPVVKSKTETIG